MLNNFIQNILDKIQGNSLSEGYVIHSKDIYEQPIPFSKTIRRNKMKKAILVGDYSSVQALNKLFEQGYTVESVDDRGIYILKRDELKSEPIKITINLDTKAIKKSIEKAAQRIRNMKDEIDNMPKQPHIRIEFDDIRDVPKVWVDGELIGDGSDDKPLINLKVDWNTDTAVKGHKEFDIRYYDSNDGIGKFKDCREGTSK